MFSLDFATKNSTKHMAKFTKMNFIRVALPKIYNIVKTLNQQLQF